ncbi:MAG TPA: FtsQ-type POTRA domain-containing protein [Acidimicrobiales bacterium]|nr:FtsQ-type POTRA domain-containing protein [Acidimicrobiales bacterium]
MTSTLRSSDGRVIVPERLRRRRVAVRRDRGRRRLRRLVAFGVLALILVVGWVLLRSPLLAVGQVTVSGSSHVDRAQVARASGIAPGVAMMDVSPGEAENRLESLPWVQRATVSREWPNRVRVELVDRSPVAQVASGSSFALVDADGRVLETGVRRATDLPLLEGRRATAPGTRMTSIGPLLDTASALPTDYHRKISGISLTDDGSVALTMDGNGVVTLGGSDRFAAKFASLTAVIAHLGSLREGCTLDVSVPTSPTLTPEAGCAD